jgi:hypothetical protein
VAGLAGASFLAGAACIALAFYLFSRKKGLAVAGVPAWAPALALGALLTFIVPGCLAFLLFYALVSPTPPPPPTCYAPKPPTCYAVGPSAIAGLALGRGELLERLHKEGSVPDHIYRRVKDR